MNVLNHHIVLNHPNPSLVYIYCNAHQHKCKYKAHNNHPNNLQLSAELGFTVVPKANLTFSKCLEMNLNDHIQTIAKVAEVAGKEYSIEQVGDENILFLSKLCDLKNKMHFSAKYLQYLFVNLVYNHCFYVIKCKL